MGDSHWYEVLDAIEDLLGVGSTHFRGEGFEFGDVFEEFSALGQF